MNVVNYPGWNAVGTFLDSYPDAYYHVLKENGDAFRSVDAEPLIPTLAKEVYANQFTTTHKRITLLYNGGAKAVDAPVLRADLKPGEHYFDLLSGEELPVKNGMIRLTLWPGDVATVARLPRSLKIGHAYGGWTITMTKDVPNASVALCDDKGVIFEQKNFVNGKAYLDAYGTTIKYVKLFSGSYLVDAMTLR